MESVPRTLVVNFNAPELNQLAAALAQRCELVRYVRPYVNKGRPWERGLEALPWAGRLYAGTFGRRRMNQPALALQTHEAGVLPDLCAAGLQRARVLPAEWRRRGSNALYKRLRESVAEAAVRFVPQARCVVAYEGFALPAFAALRQSGAGRAVLNYPVAHHRQRRRVRAEENEREPTFASTWPDFDDWPPGHEARLDEEIDLADAVLVGSQYAADSFVAEGIARERVQVVPYGVDLDVFQPAAQPPEVDRPFRAIFAGQLTQRKGLSYLLRGYERFAQPGTELTLVGAPVGDGRALAPWAHLFRHVAHQTRPALAQRYRDSDAFVFPTLLEGMGLVVLEAMACGLPVIVTDNGPGDLVRDGVDGFVIPDRDPEAIADALDRLHRDRALRLEMGRRAALRAREFSWDTYTARVCALLAAQ